MDTYFSFQDEDYDRPAIIIQEQIDEARRKGTREYGLRALNQLTEEGKN
jgi:hypothetical protein